MSWVSAALGDSFSEGQTPLPEPLARCPTVGQAVPALEEEANLHHALKTFCEAGLGSVVEFYVDPHFKGTHDRLKDKNGWIDKAYVTFMGVESGRKDLNAEEDLLVQSIHHFSKYPVVLANFGLRLPEMMTPERFPNLIVMHAKSVREKPIDYSFNFNKMTAMLFSKVRTGVVLDADQFVNKGVDYMLERASEETTAAYPFPVLPVHWLSRDPEDKLPGAPYAFHFKNSSGPKRTMRWSHSHPSWTHYALPFIANWTSYVLAPQRTDSPQWLRDQGNTEDEDLLNFGLWAAGATKQWCKFDIADPRHFDKYFAQSTTEAGATEKPPQTYAESQTRVLFSDSKFYPKGIPLVFFTAHGAKNPSETYSYLSRLWKDDSSKRNPIMYDGKWFESGKALKSYDPGLKCII